MIVIIQPAYYIQLIIAIIYQKFDLFIEQLDFYKHNRDS